MYKNQLQELAQRSCFNLPSYSCIREGPDHAPRFKASVNFNGEVFESPTFCTTLRQAEHAAAEVALNTLSRKGPISLAARVLDETGVYRNLLQETAHRAGLNLPVYTTVRSGPGHMPIFTCTVALAGMSFMGDSARNKKQAQKNAALTAWSALKQLPHAGTSASSSPPLDSESNEEQEQVTIARILASLKPADGNRPQSQNDVQRGRRKSMSCLREKNSSSIVSMHTMHYQRWSCPSFSPEVSVYQLWQQQQQSHFLVLPRPASVTKPRFLPFTESGSPSNDVSSHFCPSIDQELWSCTPSPFYSSTQTIGIAVRNNSRDTIQETRKENQMEDKLRACGGFREDETVSTGQNNNFSSRTRGFHSSTVQGGYVSNGSAEPKHLEAADESRKDDSSDVDPGTARFRSGTSDSCQSTILRTCFSNDMHVDSESWDIYREHSQKEELDRSHNDSTDSSLIPQDTQSAGFRPKFLDVKSPSHGPRPFDSLSSRSAPCQTGQFGPSAGMRSFRRPYTMAAPVTIRSAIPVYAAKPRMDSIANHIPSSNFMAPTVQVRHVMPIHSAAPVNKLPKPDNELLHSDQKRSAEPRGVAAVISALGKLEI